MFRVDAWSGQGAVMNRMGSDLDQGQKGKFFQFRPCAKSRRRNRRGMIGKGTDLFEALHGREGGLIWNKSCGDGEESFKVVLFQEGEDQVVEIEKRVIKGKANRKPFRKGLSREDRGVTLSNLLEMRFKHLY